MQIIEDIRQVGCRHPLKIAIKDQAGELTYAEFLRRVNGLAAALRERSIGPGCRVAIHLDRSAAMMVAIFGTLASGAAYVPLDPKNPRLRLCQIIEDSEPSLILSREEDGDLAESKTVPRLSSNDWGEQEIEIPVTDDGPAYVIYTSGSTGRPKGVVIGHDSLKNYLSWALSELPFTGGGVPVLGSISFDHAITCYFPPLLKGEPVILLPSLQDGKGFAASLLTGHHYSFVKITPSHARLLTVDQRAELGTLTDLLIFGGERLPPKLVLEVRRDAPNLAVMNHYGPTEATVGCCVYRVPKSSPQTTIPIGRPIPGVEAMMRVAKGELAKPGKDGELLIGGQALAKGYWGLPEQTASHFVEITDARQKPGRWYCTGDLVRLREDGNFEFVGRVDDQIKIAGFRIELAEIEQALLSNPTIGEVATIVTERNHEAEIIAAVTTSGPITEEEIRSELRLRLPSPMIPSRIVVFDKLPATAAGKLDRQVILERIRPDGSGGTLELSTENSLKAKFREALGLTDIDVDDDFFELGGDSLAAVEITTWASEHFQIDLEIPALFENPTIETLAERIRFLSNNIDESRAKL